MHAHTTTHTCTHAHTRTHTDIHATNVAIQKKSPTYSSANGCKWLLRSLRQYMYAHETEAASVDACFKAIETIILKSLQSVKGVMMNDKHCFEIYGYDILIDEKLRP
jgi:tubulin polyglutamylase TTLL9